MGSRWVPACFGASASPPSIEALEMMSGKIFAVKQSIVDDTWRVPNGKVGMMGHPSKWGRKLHSIYAFGIGSCDCFDVLFSRL